MTPLEEEGFLLDQLLGARHALEMHKAKKYTLEKRLAEVEQAMLDYMIANGVKAMHVGHNRITLGESFSVAVADIEAVPEEFVRIKTTKEPDKMKIRREMPQGNWYNIEKSHKLTVTTKV